jgi:STE24 endopeptidase
LTLAVRFWLASRHIRHVLKHRGAVPAEFAEKISLQAHQKAADYTIARTKFGMLSMLLNAAVLVGFTLLGGLQWLSIEVYKVAGPGMAYQIGLLVAYVAIAGLIDLPLEYYRQFRLEASFGFNKMTLGLFFMDMVKGIGVGAVTVIPLIWVVLTLMEKSGSLWWLYAWAVWTAFQLFYVLIHPMWIAPLFNKFTPLTDESLKTRIEGLLRRVDFKFGGLFVMDGSRRSAHGNAYFAGYGATRRIVFFDTLLERLLPQEVEAVLAHELGHFKLKHIVKRISTVFALSLPFFALLGWLVTQPWFFMGLGVDPLALPGASNNAMALLLFMLVLPVFLFPLAPLASMLSRRHEFEADAFAAKHTDARDLVSALVRMYDDNASTLTPDPLHSAFYDSHPPASIRIRQLNVGV